MTGPFPPDVVDFFEFLINAVKLEAAAPDFDLWVDRIRAARQAIAEYRKDPE